MADSLFDLSPALALTLYHVGDRLHIEVRVPAGTHSPRIIAVPPDPPSPCVARASGGEGAARFWIDWSSGRLRLPYQSCTLPQAFRAYLKHAERSGDPNPLARPLFTHAVLTVSEAHGRPCVNRVMRVDRRITRMLLIADPPPDRKLGEFAAECSRQFEPELKRYLGIRGGTRM